MKLRTDYVSNSSSSSFVVVLPKNYALDDFINDAVKSCSENPDYAADKAFIERVDKSNRRNLDYCLNTYQLLFLGGLHCGAIQSVHKGKEDCDMVRKVFQENSELGYTDEKILKDTEEEVVIEYPVEAFEVVVDSNFMDWKCHRLYPAKPENTEKVKYEFDNRVENIVKLAKKYESMETGMEQVHLYEITMNTILNTEDLIKAGYKVDLVDNWCKDLDALKKRLEEGDRLFGIRLNQAGDGMDSGTIYGLSGWDSDFNRYADVQILHCENE